jgi:2-keto-4-pentenoate hydratase/2-oxohepta-3-ene-1,7-dioic acid hydratase in catechol pathway
MRLLTFQAGSEQRLGALRENAPDQVVDLRALADAVGGAAPPPDMLGLIDQGPDGLARVRGLLAHIGRADRAPVVRALAELTLLAPIPTPRGNVIAIGRNYAKHAEESARLRGIEVAPPTIFTKAATTVSGPYADFVIDDAVSKDIDWEVELGVVIGRAGTNVARADALAHVFGYTVVNDISARDIQHGWGGQWFKGKSLDGSCPTGPWIVTADEVPDPQALQLRLRVNGVTKQDANTRDMIYPVDAIIEWASVGMTLPSGTLIATGTPEGVGAARQPPEFLKPGDVVEAEVDGLGCLRNRMAGTPV